jgi:hypothetical protein
MGGARSERCGTLSEACFEETVFVLACFTSSASLLVDALLTFSVEGVDDLFSGF